MSIQITGRQITINDERREYLENSLAGLDKYNLGITEKHVVAKKTHNGIEVEFIISVPGHPSYVFKAEDKDFFVAVANTYESAEKTLRRLHDKIVTEKKRHDKLELVDSE